MGVDWYNELEMRSVSQSELAREIGVAPQTVNRIVRGARHGAPWTRRAMAEALRRYPPVFGPEQEDQS